MALLLAADRVQHTDISTLNDTQFYSAVTVMPALSCHSHAAPVPKIAAIMGNALLKPEKSSQHWNRRIKTPLLYFIQFLRN